MKSPIAIIGMGSLFPKAGDLKSFWRNIRGGVDSITDIPASHWSPDDYFDSNPSSPDRTYCKRGGFLTPHAFDPLEFGIPPNALEATDTAQLLGLVVAKAALEDAGYGTGREFDRERVSVILGVTGTQELVIPLGARLGHPIWRKALRDSGVPEDKSREVVERISAGYVPWQENSFPGLLGNVVAGRIANRLDLGGTNCVVDAACASSLSAAHLAILELATGKSDLVLTGGVDALNDIFMYMCFSKTPALSPTGDSRPFDESADGTILGEGIGMLVLKRLADAERDHDRIYAVIKSIGTSSDGRSKSIYAPRSEGQAKALRAAYREADVSPSTIQLVEAHGTGTKAGDLAEVEALKTVYREARADGTWCALGSVKSQIGHTKAAAGAAGLIKAALALHHKILPPTLKVKKPNPKLGLDGNPFYISSETRPWAATAEHPRRAAVSAFGFGGSNFHAVLEEYRGEKSEASWDGSVELVALSADSSAGIRALLAEWATVAADLPARAAKSREQFRPAHPFRLVFVADAEGAIAKVRAAFDRAPDSAWETPEGAYYRVGAAAPGKLAFLYPGQGSQYVGMGRDLACVFPEFRPDPRVSRFIYPVPVFTDAARLAQQDELRATDVAQPALGAVDHGMDRILARFGILPDAVAGHSFGELVALCAAGRISADALGELATRRGELMASPAGDAGTMLAVKAPLETIAKSLEEKKLDLVLANRNAPKLGVLSGSQSEIERAVLVFAEAGIATIPLAVAGAFHSAFVEGAARPFRASLEKIAFAPGSIPVYSNTTGSPYPSGEAKARDLIGAQLARPVDFVGMIETMHRDGVRTFVEVGPRTTLRGLVGAILEGREHVALALDASSGKKPGLADLARVVAQLAALGHKVELRAWENTQAQNRVPAKTAIPIGGANYRSPTTPRPPSRPAPQVQQPRQELSMDDKALHAAIQAAQDNLRALQSLQETTAALHRKFLEGQEKTQLGYQRIFEQQSRLLNPGEHFHAPAPEAVSVVATAPVAVAVPVAVTVPVAAPVSDGLDQVLLAVVGEKTGYPVESLQLDMDLESDLGIDSIKRVEILAGVRERVPSAPAIEPEHLGKLRTLRQVVDFISSKKTTAAPAKAAVSSALFETTLLAVVAEKTGYPVESLQLDMDLESDLGIDSIKRVEILAGIRERIPSAPAVEPEQLGKLRTLRQIVEFISAKAPAKPAPQVAPPAPKAPAPIERQVLRTVELPKLSDAPLTLAPGQEVFVTEDGSPLSAALVRELQAKGLRASIVPCVALTEAQRAKAGGVILLAPAPAKCGASWPESSEDFLKNSFRLARSAGKGVAFLATVTRLGGTFGIDSMLASELDPTQGGLAGLAKTAAAEWPEARVRAIDLSTSWSSPDETARALVRELAAAMGNDNSPLEIGLSPEKRIGLELVAESATSARPALSWNDFAPGEAILVSGGARGVTAAAATALAERLASSGAKKTTLVLLGRSAAPAVEESWLKNLVTEAEIKKAISDQAQARGETASPRAIGEAFKKIASGREIRQTLDRIGALVPVRYFPVDLRDPVATRAAVSEIRKSGGAIAGVVHGAGLLEDKRIEDKSDAQFESVFDTKVRGLRALLEATSSEPLRFLALFSSVSGRFGRRGQVDYAMANEVLNKVAQRESRRRPACRVVAMNWGPWEGGMVGPGLRKEFEKEGVSLIPLDGGARAFVEELSAGAAVEVVLGAGLPRVEARPRAQTLSIAFQREVSLERHPFLESHRLGGRPVLPLAITMEWLAHGALHGNPGLRFHGFSDLRVLRGLTFESGSAAISVLAGAATPGTRPDTFNVPIELRTDVLHARGVAILTSERQAPPSYEFPEDLTSQGYSRPIEAAYRDVLFHGPHFRGLGEVLGISDRGISAHAQAAPGPSKWIVDPPRTAWIADPLALDAGFQLAILWCQDRLGAPSLPTRVGSYRQFSDFPKEGVRISFVLKKSGPHAAAGDLVFAAADGTPVALLEDYECAVDPGLRAAFGKSRPVAESKQESPARQPELSS